MDRINKDSDSDSIARAIGSTSLTADTYNRNRCIPKEEMMVDNSYSMHGENITIIALAGFRRDDNAA